MLKSPPNSWDLCGPRAYTKTNIFFDTVSETNWYNWHLKSLQRKFACC